MDKLSSLSMGPDRRLSSSPDFECYYLGRLATSFLYSRYSIENDDSLVLGSLPSSIMRSTSTTMLDLISSFGRSTMTPFDHRPFLTESVAYAILTRKSLPPKTLYLLFMTLKDSSLVTSAIWKSSRNFFESEVRTRS